MIKELICISCPLGCHLTADTENKVITGNTCKRGEVYGLNEITNPVRVITSTVKIEGASLPVLPVKTNGAIPRGLNFEAMKIINNVNVIAPIKVKDIIIENILGTGIDVVATKTMDCDISYRTLDESRTQTS